MFQYSNNQSDPLAANITAGATSISVSTAISRPIPTPASPMLGTLIEGANIEVVWMYGSTSGGGTTTYQVIRGAEGTTARAFTTAAFLEVRFTAKGGRRSQQAFNADLILTQNEEVLTQDGNVLTFDDVSFASTSA